MKRNVFLLAVGLVAMATTSLANAASPYLGNPPGGGPAHFILTNPEPVKPGQLPAATTNFLATYFPACTIDDCEHTYTGYEIDLASGVDLTFESTGLWTQVKAPEGKALPADILDGLLPGKVIAVLTENGVANEVSQIRFHGGDIYRVNILANDEPYYFLSDGVLVNHPVDNLTTVEVIEMADL
ncbi:MAG: hypothetical protein LIO90_06080 [Bacteroidales bacterium]|nr:hypothetical protein [Bacteroidales bacterium]